MAAFLRALRGANLPRVPVGLPLAIGGVALAGYGVSESLYNVEGGHRAVMFNRITGVNQQVIGEGTHIRVPWFDRPIIYDVRFRPRNIPSLTGTKDLQMVNVTLRVVYAPMEENLPKIYQSLGLDYDERVLPSIANEVMKSVVAQYNVSQLITQRDQVSDLIRRRLIERAKSFYISLSDVSITHLTFGREYSQAVEAKQVAQQEAERAKFVVDRAIQDKKSAIIRATGEAEAAKMIGRATSKNPAFLELRRIEAAREIASLVARSPNKMYLDASALMLNVSMGQDISQQVAGLAEGMIAMTERTAQAKKVAADDQAAVAAAEEEEEA